MLTSQGLPSRSGITTTAGFWLVVIGFLSLCASVQGQTVLVTPKNGVPSAWELVTVDSDRFEVRRGGARFEFSKDQIDKVTNPEATQLLNDSEKVLAEYALGDPGTFENLADQIGRLASNLDAAAKKYDWLIPELGVTRDRINEARSSIETCLGITREIAADLVTIEQMASGRTPVTAQWEQVVDQTITKAAGIPIDGVRQKVSTDLEKYRRNIRLTLSRRIEETANRVRTRGQALLSELQQGLVDESQWGLMLRDLRQLVDEQIPSPGMKEELSDFLDGLEAQFAEGLEAGKTRASVRKIQEQLDRLNPLVSDATRTTEFTEIADGISAHLGELTESATKEALAASLSERRTAHSEALAALERERQAKLAATAPGSSRAGAARSRQTGWMGTLSDPKAMGGAFGGVIVLLLLLRRFGPWRRKTASEIEDVPGASRMAPAGWAGGQEDLLTMLGGTSSAPPAPTEPVLADVSADIPAPLPDDEITAAFLPPAPVDVLPPSSGPAPPIPAEEDPFGIWSDSDSPKIPVRKEPKPIFVEPDPELDPEPVFRSSDIQEPTFNLAEIVDPLTPRLTDPTDLLFSTAPGANPTPTPPEMRDEKIPPPLEDLFGIWPEGGLQAEKPNSPETGGPSVGQDLFSTAPPSPVEDIFGIADDPLGLTRVPTPAPPEKPGEPEVLNPPPKPDPFGVAGGSLFSSTASMEEQRIGDLFNPATFNPPPNPNPEGKPKPSEEDVFGFGDLPIPPEDKS